MKNHVLVIILILFTVISNAQPPTPRTDEAAALYKRGIELYRSRQYAEAIDAFKEYIRLEAD